MKRLAVFLGLMLSGATAVLADTSCQSVATDLTGPNVFGQHTMGELQSQTKAGNCSAAAYLSRRAKDAQGFLETNCPAETQLRDEAAAMVKLAQKTLETPECQN